MRSLARKPVSDDCLVRLARKGDNEAFGELMSRYWYMCVRLAVSFLRNYADAEDEVQNAFSKAFAHLEQYQGEAEFSTWLARIVTNQCLMFMRVKRRTSFVYLDETLRARGAPPPMELPACGPDPEGEFAFEQIKQILNAELRRMPPLFRNVILLRDINGLPIHDVANQLGITVPAAKSRLMRARAEIRRRLLGYSEKCASTSALARCAAPFSRVAHHGRYIH